jgi:hypothetical protein
METEGCGVSPKDTKLTNKCSNKKQNTTHDTEYVFRRYRNEMGHLGFCC